MARSYNDMADLPIESSHARFGGGPTEKARASGTSPAAYPTRWEAVGKGRRKPDLAGGPPDSARAEG